jgi:hypothetical protein
MRKSEVTSPMGVVRTLTTQKMRVISGTFLSAGGV